MPTLAELQSGQPVSIEDHTVQLTATNGNGTRVYQVADVDELRLGCCGDRDVDRVARALRNQQA